VVLRDAVRNEVAKQKQVEEEMSQEQEQLKMSIGNYNSIINVNEQQLVGLRKRYDDAINERNERGIMLIKRGEEVCVMAERANVQELVLKRGNFELQVREEEQRFLKIRLDEERRQLTLARKAVPNEQALRRELDALRQQVTFIH
jgi:hypothetical protein